MMNQEKPVNITFYLTDDDRELFGFLLRRRYGYKNGGLQVGAQAAVKEIINQEALAIAREEMVKERGRMTEAKR